MILIREVFVTEAVLDADFACRLAECRGDCCRVGGGGAPLTPEEADYLETLAPERADPTGWAKVARRAGRGPVAVRCGRPQTALLLDGEVAGVCHLARPEEGILVCSLERDGGHPFPKPLSCHLFPIRVERFLGRDLLTLELRPECAAAVGGRTPLVHFLKRALIRAYGEAFYRDLKAAAKRRRSTGSAVKGRSATRCPAPSI